MLARSTSLRLAVSASAIAMSAICLSSSALAATCVWNGGTGNWSPAGGWTACAVPTSADDVVIALAGSTVNLTSISAFAKTLDLGGGNILNLNNSNLYMGGNVTNNGTINIFNGSQLFGNGVPVTFGGTGVIALNNASNFAQINGQGKIFTFGSGQTVRGAGTFGVNNTYISNAGLISADVNGATLVMDAAGGNGGVGSGGVGTGGTSSLFNSGTMQATGGGILRFEGGRYENAGTIQALAGSVVALGSDSRIMGGTLTSVGSGVISATGVSNYLNDVTLSTGSNYDQNNTNTYLNGSLTNNGTWTIRNGSQLLNELGGSGDLTINGTGTIVLDNSANFAHINGNGGKVIFGSNQSVVGKGDVGVNNTLIVNNNIFSANSGSAINIDAKGGNGGVGGSGLGAGNNASLFNANIIEATGNSAVTFFGGRYENAASAIIRALNNSVINLGNDSRIVGGTLTSDASSVIRATSVSNYLNDVTLSSGSNYDQNNTNTYLNGSLTNNGTWTIRNGSQLLNELGGSGDLTINGTGTIVLDNSVNFAYINGNGGKVIFGSNQAITGSGNIGVNNTYIVNNNAFSASGGGTISIDATGGNGGVGGAGVGTGGNAGLLNNNVIEAVGGSILSFEGGRYENAAGAVIRAFGGSTTKLNGDSRIVGGTLTSDGTSTISATSVSNYLNNVTLSAGSKYDQNNTNTYLNGSVTVDGTWTIRNGSQLFNELGGGGPLTIGGNGTIVLDNSSNFAYINGNGGKDIFGAALTIRGKGNIGLNNTYIRNDGTISADAGTGTGISIDATGGNGGVSGAGFGTGNNSGLLNNGTIQAANGSSLSLESGRYENSATGTFGAIGAGSLFIMNGDANLTNLQTGNVLNLGSYISSTTGVASTLNIRGTGTNSIATIGTGAVGTDTIVTLSGANSVFNVTNFSSGANTSLDSTLTNVAQSGRLNLLNNRGMAIVAGGGAFTNAGIVQLGGGTFGSTSYTNSGLTTGFGTITPAISNTGTVEAAGGTLVTNTITGPSGTMRSNAGATLDVSTAANNSTTGFLTNNGNLTIGTKTVTVTSDYTNAAYGSGNAFNAHANVSGSGFINATSATMDLSGPALSGGIINVGNVRTGGSSSTTLTITNNGTATTLRGAVQNTNAPSIALSSQDWVLNPNGGSTTVTLSYTGTIAGSLSGQTLDVVNNFDNVGNTTIGISGNVYQVAQAGSLPSSLMLAARRVGDAAATAGFTVANGAPVTPGFNEDLQANLSVGSGFTLNGSAVETAVVAAGSNQSVTLSHGTATAGAFTSVVNIANTSLAVTGSGLSNLALAGQSINVTGNVYQAAVASLGSNIVNFGTVRQGSASPTGSVNITNAASGALTDSLVTSVSGLPAGVSGTGPGPLASGQSGNASFSVSTATAGVISGSGSLDFTSTNNEMAALALSSQTVNFTGTITQLANGSIFKNGGLGVLAGAGNAFTLNLGQLGTNTGAFTTDLGVINLLAPSAFAELLGGSFTQGAGAGFSFAGNTFTGLAGGASNIGNLLTFDTTGLGNGFYTKQVTFNGISSFTGLNDFTVTPITIDITAEVTGSIANPVPEPTTWMMMLFGFVLIGTTIRRNRLAAGQLA